MANPTRWTGPLIFFPLALLGWIIVLSAGLRFLFDAGVTGSWLIVGGMFTGAAVWIVILLKELNEAIILPDFAMLLRRDPPPDRSVAVEIEFNHLAVDSRRSALMLGAAVSGRNRYRSRARRRSCTAVTES